MYQLESAKVKPFGRNGFWQDEDISAKTIGEIFQDYKKGILILSNNFLVGTLYLDIEDMKSLVFINTEITLSNWFIEIGNTALPTTTVAPDFSSKIVKYGDAWKANYDFQEVSPTANPDSQLPLSSRPDLLLKREGTDYMAMGKQCLVSINGLLHLSGGSVHGLRVRDGGHSARIANKTQVGLLSFNQIGDFQLIPFNRSMVANPNEYIDLKQRIYLNVGTEITNKGIMLSIGGYLHAIDTTAIGGLIAEDPGSFHVVKTAGNYWITGLSIAIDINKPFKIGQHVTGSGIPTNTTLREWIITGNQITSLRLSNQIEFTNTSAILIMNEPASINIFDVVGPSTIRINWFKIPFIQRYMESRKLIDLSTLGLSVNPDNESQVSIEELYTDETILRYLELSQSFLIAAFE